MSSTTRFKFCGETESSDIDVVDLNEGTHVTYEDDNGWIMSGMIVDSFMDDRKRIMICVRCDQKRAVEQIWWRQIMDIEQ